MNSRVFILMPHDKDISQAERYGVVTSIYYEGEVRPSIWSDSFVDLALDRLRDAKYDPSTDYICCIGPQVPLVMFIVGLCCEYDFPQCLFFNAQIQDYVVKIIGGTLEETRS